MGELPLVASANHQRVTGTYTIVPLNIPPSFWERVGCSCYRHEPHLCHCVEECLVIIRGDRTGTMALLVSVVKKEETFRSLIAEDSRSECAWMSFKKWRLEAG